MKIDRRSFLTLVAGGAVGTALSPLPFKLMDDISIWSQNFRGLPIEVPVPEDGPATYVDSVCSLCPGGCGISVRKIGKRAVKIEGRPGYPVNDGGVCLLGISGLQLLYGPWRVTGPRKKVNGKWKPVSWDQALSEIADRLADIRNSGRPHSIAAISGRAKGTVPGLLKRFVSAAGSPNFFNIPANDDAYSYAIGRMFGRAGAVGFDFENSDFVLCLGSGILDGWGSPVRMFQAHSSWKNSGTKTVQVEPRLSNTAAKADAWIPAKPGTEADLALGLANVIIRDGMYNRQVERGRAFGRLVKLVADYTPARVSATTGVKEETIEKLAAQFAAARRPLVICGRGKGHTPSPAREVMATIALNALMGSINRSGGMIVSPEFDYIKWDEPVLDQSARTGLSASPAGTLTDLLKQAADGSSVQALFLLEANPAYTMHDAGTVKKAIDAVPLVVSLSSYMDESSNLADYILPLHSYLERMEDVPVTAALKIPLVSLSKPVVEPLYDTRHPGDVIIQLARKMGGSISDSFGWDDYETCLRQTFGAKWAKLSADGYIRKSTLETFIDTALTGRMDFTPLAEACANSSGRQKNSKDALLVPYDSMRIAADNIGTPPFCLKTVSDRVLKKNMIYVDVNPVTARKAGVADGRTVTLETPAGKAVVMVNVTDEVAPGVVAMPRGFGHTAYDDYIKGKGVNVNELLMPEEDPVSGFDVACVTPVKFTKA